MLSVFAQSETCPTGKETAPTGSLEKRGGGGSRNSDAKKEPVTSIKPSLLHSYPPSLQIGKKHKRREREEELKIKGGGKKG